MINRPKHFPYAPVDWSPEAALGNAQEEGIELEEDHWVVILALQEFFAHHDNTKQVNRRLLHDALNEKFHHKDGLGYLYRLLPGGPLPKVVVCLVWRCQPVAWTDPTAAPHNTDIFNPGGAFDRRSTVSRFKSMFSMARLLITRR